MSELITVTCQLFFKQRVMWSWIHYLLLVHATNVLLQYLYKQYMNVTGIHVGILVWVGDDFNGYMNCCCVFFPLYSILSFYLLNFVRIN